MTEHSVTLTVPPSKKAKPTARTRKAAAEAAPSTFVIHNLAHDGRGVASYGTDDAHLPEKHGKKVFISFALPNETVSVKITNSKKGFEEGDAIGVLANPHPGTPNTAMPTLWRVWWLQFAALAGGWTDCF